MSNPVRNAAGTLLGENGFVLCRMCLRECDLLSKETSPDYALCQMHRHPNVIKEEAMPAVPKPSRKARRTKRTKAVASPRKKRKAPITGAAPRQRKRKMPQPQQAPEGPIMTAEQAAAHLGVTIWRVRNLVKAGHLKASGDGGWRAGISSPTVTHYYDTRGHRKGATEVTA